MILKIDKEVKDLNAQASKGTLWPHRRAATVDYLNGKLIAFTGKCENKYNQSEWSFIWLDSIFQVLIGPAYTPGFQNVLSKMSLTYYQG